MKTTIISIILAVSAFAADKPAPKPTDAQQAQYWRLMSRASAEQAKLLEREKSIREQAEKAISKAKDESAAEQQKIGAEYSKVFEDVKKTCGGDKVIVKQGDEGFTCEAIPAAKEK